MSPKVALILLSFVLKVNGDFTQTNALIQRIHKESAIQTVYLFGNTNEVHNFLDYPRLVFNTFLKNFTHNLVLDKNVLVLMIVPPNQEHITKLIEPIKRRQFVAIYAERLMDLRKYFEWFWEKKFTRIFGTTGADTYAYLPYASCKIQKLDAHGPLPDAQRDLNGFAIRTNVYKDAPRVFAYKDRNGNRKIGGSAAQLFFGFLQKHNATFTEVIVNKSPYFYLPSLRRALNNNELDFSMTTFTSVEGLRLTYPIRFMRWDVLVPYNGNIPANEYFIRPFKGSTWATIILMGVYIISMGVLCDYYTNRMLKVWENSSRVVCLALGIATEHRIHRNYRFYVLLHLYSFVLTNLYIIHLTSFLTVFIKSKEIDTLDEIIDKNLTIWVGPYERIQILKTYSLPPDFEKVLIATDKKSYTNLFHKYADVGMASSGERTEFFLSQHIHLKHPYFHVCKESMTKFFTGFLLQPHSQFGDLLDRYIVEIRETGLIWKWVSDAVYQGREAGILKTPRDKEVPCAPLTLYHFAFARNCYAAGLFLSLVAFIGEKLLKLRKR